jgi:hypothetical protein
MASVPLRWQYKGDKISKKSVNKRTLCRKWKLYGGMGKWREDMKKGGSKAITSLRRTRKCKNLRTKAL